MSARLHVSPQHDATCTVLHRGNGVLSRIKGIRVESVLSLKGRKF